MFEANDQFNWDAFFGSSIPLMNIPQAIADEFQYNFAQFEHFFGCRPDFNKVVP
jgi:hypothetical protein